MGAVSYYYSVHVDAKHAWQAMYHVITCRFSKARRVIYIIAVEETLAT